MEITFDLGERIFSLLRTCVWGAVIIYGIHITISLLVIKKLKNEVDEIKAGFKV